MQIEIESLPVKTISDTSSRKGSAPQVLVAPPLSSRTESDMSQTTLGDDGHKEIREMMASFQITKGPLSAGLANLNNASTAEIALLRARVERLELKFEELQLAVHKLQWHSDPQRQAALEDWAIERMISIYHQVYPQTKSTVSELIRLFALSKQKHCLTTAEFEHLRSLPRVRDILVEDFMMSPSWFSQNSEKDVREIARFVVQMKDQESRKQNYRLYRFVTGRSPKTNVINTKYI